MFYTQPFTCQLRVIHSLSGALDQMPAWVLIYFIRSLSEGMQDVVVCSNSHRQKNVDLVGHHHHWHGFAGFIG
jgi:hypothetical protein